MYQHRRRKKEEMSKSHHDDVKDTSQVSKKVRKRK